MRVYISGPISGNEEYRDQFRRAAEVLDNRGISYINPAEIITVMPAGNWGEYMRIAATLVEMADAITFLDGWELSTGARMERAWAQMRRLPEYDLATDTFKRRME